MTAAQAVLALLLVLLVFLPAAALAIRLAGARLARRGPAVATPDGPEVEPLGALELAGFASAGELAALSPRERRFVAQAAGPRLAQRDVAGGWVPPSQPETAQAPVPPPAPDREVSLAAFLLVCPACGTSLGATADVAHYVGSCPGCSRRVATRRRGSRVSLATVDTVPAPTRRRPRQ